MFIPIPIGDTRTCSVTATVPRFVLCEICGVEYVYLSVRSGTGTASNPLWLAGAAADREARERAESSLQEALASGLDPIPCPNCANYQRSMMPAARIVHFYRLRRYSLYVALFSLPPLFFFWMVYKYLSQGWLASLVLAGCILIPLSAVGAFLYGTIAAAKFDPNSLPHNVRLEIGQRLAVTKERFLSLAFEAPSAEYSTKQQTEVTNYDL